MKIAYVSDAIYPYNKGGKEKRLIDITTRMVALGHEVHVYCMKWWKTPELHRVERGVHLHAISPLYPLYNGERRSIKQAILFGISCLKLIKEDWDVIDVDHMPFYPVIFTKIVCILKRKRMIATWHEVWGLEYWKKYIGWKAPIAYLVEKFSVFLPDYIITITDNTNERIKSVLGRRRNISTVLCGLDLDYINNVKPAAHTSDIIFAGRLLEHKNIDLIIKAIALLKKKGQFIRTLIIGNGPEKKKLINLTEKFGLQNQIEFIDFLPKHSDVLSYIKSSKIFVFPSEREGFGLVAIEANACGIPFITSSHEENAAQYLIEGNNGFLFDLTVEKLIEVIEKNINNLQSKTIYLDVAKKYDWNKNMSSILQIYSI